MRAGAGRGRAAAPPAGRAEAGLTLLTGYLERYPSLDLLDTVFQYTLEAKGADLAVAKTGDQAHPVFCLMRRTVHPSLAVGSVRELIAMAKAQPGGLNYSTGGPGSPQPSTTQFDYDGNRNRRRRCDGAASIAAPSPEAS